MITPEKALALMQADKPLWHLHGSTDSAGLRDAKMIHPNLVQVCGTSVSVASYDTRGTVTDSRPLSVCFASEKEALEFDIERLSKLAERIAETAKTEKQQLKERS